MSGHKNKMKKEMSANMKKPKKEMSAWRMGKWNVGIKLRSNVCSSK